MSSILEFKKLLATGGVRDTDLKEAPTLNGDEVLAIVQDNIQVRTTVEDLLSLANTSFITAPMRVNTLDKLQQFFNALTPSGGKRLGAVVSYYDRESDAWEVVRYIGKTTNKEEVNLTSNWEWFTTGGNSFKGLYRTYDELRQAVKNPKIGDHAFVGSTLDESILYKANSLSFWEATGKVFKEYLKKTEGIIASPINGNDIIIPHTIVDKAINDSEGNKIIDTYVNKCEFRRALKERRKVSIVDLSNEVLDYFKGIRTTGILTRTYDLDYDANTGLKFANYRANEKEGISYGRIYIPKVEVDGNIILTQDNLPYSDTIYIVRFKHDLQGATITVPANSVLDFTYGGSFCNGTLVFSDNVIVRVFKADQLCVTTKGTYKYLDASTVNPTKGDKGDKGDTGIQGPKGDKGDKGEKGNAGINGINGVNGKNGITPRLKVEVNWVWVSYDEGISWGKLFEIPAPKEVPTPSPTPSPNPNPPADRTSKLVCSTKFSDKNNLILAGWYEVANARFAYTVCEETNPNAEGYGRRNDHIVSVTRKPDADKPDPIDRTSKPSCAIRYRDNASFTLSNYPINGTEGRFAYNVCIETNPNASTYNEARNLLSVTRVPEKDIAEPIVEEVCGTEVYISTTLTEDKVAIASNIKADAIYTPDTFVTEDSSEHNYSSERQFSVAPSDKLFKLEDTTKQPTIPSSGRVFVWSYEGKQIAAYSKCTKGTETYYKKIYSGIAFNASDVVCAEEDSVFENTFYKR